MYTEILILKIKHRSISISKKENSTDFDLTILYFSINKFQFDY